MVNPWLQPSGPTGQCACCGKQGRLYKLWCQRHYEHWYLTGQTPRPTAKELARKERPADE